MDGIFMLNQLKEALIFAIRRFLFSVQIPFYPYKIQTQKNLFCMTTDILVLH